MDSSIGWIVSTASSASVAIVLAIVGAYERYRLEKQNTLIRALEYLTGGSQKRSVGIALIEGLWHKEHPYYRAILPALTNQAVYLLLVTKSKGPHQSQNFSRIMNLLLRVPYDPNFEAYFIELIEALRLREDKTMATGIELAAPIAKMWIKKLAAYIDMPEAV